MGSMGVDFWKAKEWKQQMQKQQVMVMTHQILLNSLRHGFLEVSVVSDHSNRCSSSKCRKNPWSDWPNRGLPYKMWQTVCMQLFSGKHEHLMASQASLVFKFGLSPSQDACDYRQELFKANASPKSYRETTTIFAISTPVYDRCL